MEGTNTRTRLYEHTLVRQVKLGMQSDYHARCFEFDSLQEALDVINSLRATTSASCSIQGNLTIMFIQRNIVGTSREIIFVKLFAEENRTPTGW